MADLKNIAKKIIGKNFYIEDSMGMLSTDFTFKDITDGERCPFDTLRVLEDYFKKRLEKKFPKFLKESDIRLVYCYGRIGVVIEK